MAKGSNQKLKLLYLSKLFLEKTDETHGLSVQEIEDELARHDVKADRKTLYLDLEELRHFGLDIISEKNGRNVCYKLVSRDFELPELKLLVDSVQSAKFITERKSRSLIKKLSTLCSVHDAGRLQRQVLMSGRVKTMNESVYNNVDKIHTAISEDVQLRFQYYQWNVKKEMVLRRDGAFYQISPWGLIWDDEYYYLLGYDDQAGQMKHYRVDKMLRISPTEQKRNGKEIFDTMELPSYSKGLFGMFSGEQITVTLRCENRMAAPLIDRFGLDIPIFPMDEAHFQTRVPVSASEPFLGWLIGLGSGVKLVAPESMVEAMRQQIRKLNEQYL